MILHLKFVKGGTEYKAADTLNGTEPIGDDNHRTLVTKELVEPLYVKRKESDSRRV